MIWRVAWSRGWMLVWLAALISGPISRADEPAATKSDTPAAESAETTPPAQDLELLKLFADALDQVERNYVKEIDRRELMEAAIRGMLSKLDPYSNFIPPAELDKFKSSVENEFGGIGITVSTEGGGLTITSPIYGSPAYRAGLRGGDKIIEIEGEPTTGITIDEAVKRIKGKVGLPIKLTIEHVASGDKESLELTRELVRVDSVLGDTRKADDTWNFMLSGDKKIGYIRISSFSRHTADDLKKALVELTKQEMQGLILDLRYNPGGLLTAAIEVSDLFVTEGKIVSTAGRNAKPKTWKAEKAGTFDGFPLAVLVNHNSASASEIVAACLQDHGRAVIIGERTWGKGSVQNIIELEEGNSALKLTTAGYLRPSGKNIHRGEGAKDSDEWGVKPNDGLEVSLNTDEAEAYLKERRERDAIVAPPKEGTKPAEEHKFDKQLQTAYDHLLGKLDKQTAQAEPAK
ncbi:MAG: S41 family peptidase [Pirellulaceae bacterium]|nr:S41 family peptidase [Pirellulaceae bacterium]